MLNAFALPGDVDLCGSESRVRMLEVLLSEFRSAFAEIKYEVDTQTRIVNAQAFVLGGSRIVRLYAGLAFHSLLSEDALVFTLLHETGHHRARGRRFAGDPALACDCLADRWAIGPGAKVLRICSGRVLNLPASLKSLDAMIASIEVARVSAPARRQFRGPHSCWAGYWPARKLRLNSNAPLTPREPCYFNF